MTQIKTDGSKAPSYISIDSVEREKVETQEREHTSPKAPCSAHGPSQSPLLDRELQKPEAKEIISALSSALNDLSDEGKCTKCTVENISTLLTSHAREIRAAKQNGEWPKEDRKALKAEVKGLFKGVKKDVKALWKGRR
ncbi:uncharacterized protein PFLUO_LOCUS7715 [Penicillium psychrofluorescens]|uniref:uncharacterized protein n=1 Tax=Penicillium psychrofluorescens TaxID=3158075 RepID=UPI003CCD0110